MKNVIIVGGGASGLMAATQSAKNGNNVTVVEKMPRPARKVMISGKGRCNFTNACYDLNELISNVPRNPRFLYSSFSNFMPHDTIQFFEDLGVKTKVERGNRVFPESDKAVDIVDALVNGAKSAGAKIINGTVKAFETDGGLITKVILENGEKLNCDSVAICTGGLSYPLTGSTGDGYKLAKSVGHTISRIKPSLVSLVSDNNFIPKLQGLSLKNVAIKLKKDNSVIYKDFGEMLFTHYGVSGPIILSASCHIETFNDAKYSLVIDLKPALDEAELDKRIRRDFEKYVNRDFINSLSDLLPKKLIPVIVNLSGIEPSTKVNEIRKEQRKNLVQLIKNFTVNLTDFYDIETAVVTSGGVNVNEIDPKTMRSKLISNLYFAGEVIDVDAYTGGFNLQIAFSTGYACGKNL